MLMQIQPLPWLMNRDDLSVAVHFSSCAINWVVLSKLSGGGKWYLIPAITPARLLFLCAGWSSRRNAADDQRGEPSSSKGYAPTPFVGVFSFWPAGVRRRKKKKKSSSYHESNIKGGITPAGVSCGRGKGEHRWELSPSPSKIISVT